CDQTLPTEQATETLNQVNKQLMSLYQNQTSSTSTNLSLNESTPFTFSQTKQKMYQVRRTFLLIVTFDLIFMILLWIIYDQILNRTIIDAFHIEIEHYSIKTSLFDVVALSALRFILLMVSYAIMKWSHLIFVAFTTLGSTGFIIAKALVFSISKSDKGFTVNERSWERRPLINDNYPSNYRSITTRSNSDRQSFYSPVPSIDG
ncbi:unnamed protein product, partial [Didymodactylos carnosus]